MPLLGSGHWFVWDPCGIVCAVVTYILIGYGEMVVLLVLAPPFPSIGTALCVIIFTVLATLAVIAHVKAMMTDPVSCCIQWNLYVQTPDLYSIIVDAEHFSLFKTQSAMQAPPFWQATLFKHPTL